MNLPEVIHPQESASTLAVVELPFVAFRSPRQIITRAVWNSVATFASVAQALRIAAPPQPHAVAQLVCRDNLPMRARRSFAGVSIPRKGSV